MASKNIYQTLLESGFEKTDDSFENNPVYSRKEARLYLLNRSMVMAEQLDNEIKADLFIFASRHASREGKPSFCIHVQGNWDVADFGGRDEVVGICPAQMIRKGLLILDEEAKETKHDVTLEATHHGPYLDTPSLFIEVGSTEHEWANEAYANVVARSIIRMLDEEGEDAKHIAIGIGGGHYATSFNKRVRDCDLAMSHICPKYHLEMLTKEKIQQAIERTKGKVDFVLLDWKGMGKEKERILGMLEEMDIEVKRTDKFSKAQ